jgi:hypothetical protein
MDEGEDAQVEEVEREVLGMVGSPLHLPLSLYVEDEADEVCVRLDDSIGSSS